MHPLSCVASLLALTLGTVHADDIIWRFDTDGDFEGWTPSNFETVEVSGGMLRGVTRYDCMLTSPELNIPADQYSVVEFRVSSTVTGGGEIFWHAEGESFRDEVKQRHVIHASDQPRVYRSHVGAVDSWQGVIKRIRLDILNPAGAEIALDYVRITTAPPGVVPNWSFEDDLDGDDVPDGWRIDAAQFAWTPQYPAHGDRALMVRADAPRHRVATMTARVPLDRTGIYAFDATIAHQEGGTRELTARLTFFDVFGAPVPDAAVSIARTVTDKAGRRHLVGEFGVPARAAAAELTLRVQAARARLWWDAIELRHVTDTPPVCERPLEAWRAKWIWAEATRGQDDASACLRRSFELAVPPERLTQAMAQVSVDNIFALWLNGVKVAESADPEGWRTPLTVDLLPYLVRGVNVIAIQASDIASAEGALFEASLAWPDGSLEVLSDEQWKAVAEAPEGWLAAGFDDSSWPPAAVVASAGALPWGELPYEYFGPREQVELVAKQVPAQITAGEDLTVSAKISRLPATAAEAPVRLSLVREGTEVVCWTGPVSQFTARVEEGIAIGPITVRTSRFLQPGAYQVALGFPYTQYEGQEGITIASLQVRAPRAPERRPRVTISEHNGAPTLHIDGRPDPFMHYVELRVGPRRITNMADAGVHIYFLDAEDIGWKGPGSFDYTAWDAKILKLLTLDPDAFVIPQYTLEGRHQQWWLPDHPRELTQTESGSTSVGLYNAAGQVISLASQVWREESGEALRRFVQHCRSASYASRIIGYLTANGVSWEWQHWGSVGDFEPTDYSEPMLEQFRAWLRREYGGDVEALRAAWRQPEVTFEGARIPSVAQRDAADHMLFRDPRTSRYVIDFYRFFQDVMADGILHYFRIVKEASSGEALCGTYYGYVITMLGGARRAGDSGHMALSRVLESDLCDFLLSPFDYSLRSVGEPTTIMSATGSVLAHGKLWAMEADLRTHLVTDERQRGYGAPEGLDGTISQLRRAFASCATKGLAVRWYDFSNGWIADDPRQGQIIGQLRRLADQWLEWDRSPDPQGIAVVVDEDTPAAYLSHEIEAMFWLVYRQKATFEHVGAPWRVYLIDDIVAGRVPKHRAYVFLNCFHMTDEERAWIREELQSDGRTLVWLYAPGYIADDLNVARISELTGMDFREIEQMRPWVIDPDVTHPWLADLPPGEYQQPNIDIGPVFAPAREGIEVLGTWRGTDLPGLAVKRFDDWTSVWSAGPILSPTLLKRICRDAGVRVRVEGVEPSYVSRNLIGLHAAVTRTETLCFEEPTRVIDLLSGEILAAACTEVRVEVPGPGTRLLWTYPAY
ncbi:MAG: hypothetical protein AB7Y46_02590 [Armatimonadota bacterium]